MQYPSKYVMYYHSKKLKITELSKYIILQTQYIHRFRSNRLYIVIDWCSSTFLIDLYFFSVLFINKTTLKTDTQVKAQIYQNAIEGIQSQDINVMSGGLMISQTLINTTENLNQLSKLYQ